MLTSRAAQEEQQEEEVAATEQEESEADSKLAYREVPSHFYEEAKVRDTKFCGTHTRFEDDGETFLDTFPHS